MCQHLLQPQYILSFQDLGDDVEAFGNVIMDMSHDQNRQLNLLGNAPTPQGRRKTQTCTCFCFLVNNCPLECKVLVVTCPFEFLLHPIPSRWMSRLDCYRVCDVHPPKRGNINRGRELTPHTGASSRTVLQSLLRSVKILEPSLCSGPYHL